MTYIHPHPGYLCYNMKIRIVAIDQLYVDFVFGRVAQWLEHHSYKMGVDSSILSTPTQRNSHRNTHVLGELITMPLFIYFHNIHIRNYRHNISKRCYGEKYLKTEIVDNQSSNK